MWMEWIPSEMFLYFVVFTAHFGVFLNGTFVAWTSPILVKLSSLQDNPLGRKITAGEQGWLVSIGVFGNWTGSYIGGVLAKNYGRKKALIIMSIPMLISYSVLTMADSMWLMILARIAGGMTSGGMFAVDPMYFGEVTEPKNRGFLGGVMNLFMNIGTLFVLCVGPYTSFFWFHVILAACPAIYMILVLFIVVETPYYLIERNEEEAERVLKKLRAKEDVESEMFQIKEFVNNKTKTTGNISDIFESRTGKKALLITFGLVLFQQCSGVGIILSFGQSIFEEVGDFLPSDLSAIILGTAQVIFSSISPAFTDRLGRRILLLFSHIGMSVSLAVFGIYFLMKEYGYEVHQISWLPLTALVCFKFMYCAGSGFVPFIVIGEIFPQNIKGLASSMTCVVSSASALLLANSYTILKTSLGMGYTFWIFAIVGIIAVLFVKFFVLETKGKNLQEIQEALKGTKKIENHPLNI